MREFEREPARPEMTWDEEVVSFRQRLAETMAWCSEQTLTDPLRSLRSAEISPNPYELDRWRLTWGVAEKRRARLKRHIAPASDLHGGKLLMYLPDYNLCDGAAEASSRGFFDQDNIPPWDTWVWPSRAWKSFEYLVSWVPPAFLKHVAEGIRVNPEQCIRWLEDTDDGFVDLLRDAKLL